MRDLQKKVKNFAINNKSVNPPHIVAMDFVSEMGEMLGEMIKSSDYGKRPFRKTHQLKSEMGDAFYSFISLANAFKIDLESALGIVLEKYSKRIKAKGSMGNK